MIRYDNEVRRLFLPGFSFQITRPYGQKRMPDLCRWFTPTVLGQIKDSIEIKWSYALRIDE
jgi:hypothetical protein